MEEGVEELTGRRLIGGGGCGGAGVGAPASSKNSKKWKGENEGEKEERKRGKLIRGREEGRRRERDESGGWILRVRDEERNRAIYRGMWRIKTTHL